MIDLRLLVENIGDELDCSGIDKIPVLPGSLPVSEIQQPIDNKVNSRTSRISRMESECHGFEDNNERDPINFLAEGIARVEVSSLKPGSPGSPGSEAKTLAETDPFLFPLEKIETGRPGRDWKPAGAPNPAPADHAAPPSSDWWDGPAMAEVDALLAPAPPLVTPLPILPAQVRAGVERELRDLASHGRTGPGALSDAIAITRAKIRNSPLLVEAQTGAGRCLVCEEAEVADRRFIPVLTGAPGRMHWIHLECHAEHSRRLAAKVDAIMSAAGFGEEQQRGAA